MSPFRRIFGVASGVVSELILTIGVDSIGRETLASFEILTRRWALQTMM